MRCFYSPDFRLDLPEDHPYPMTKFQESRDMLLASGVLAAEDIVEVSAANSFTLLRVHDPEYLSTIYHGRLDLKEHLNTMERNLITQALDETAWVVAHAAKRLGMGRTTLVEKMRKHGLNRD